MTDVHCFDPRTMSNDATSLLVGARRSGKSTLMKYIMFKKRHDFDLAIGINTTEDSSHTMEGITSKSFIFETFENPYLRKLLDWQEVTVRKTEHTGVKRHKNIALLMDDCGDDMAKFKSKEMLEIFKKGRHRKLFFMNASQYALELGPQLRDNLDYLFVFATSGGETLKKLFKLFFASIFDGKFGKFMSTFRALTADRSAIVLDFNRMKEDSSISNCIFWVKAKPVPKFTVGDKAFLHLDAYYFDPETVRAHDIDLDLIAFGASSAAAAKTMVSHEERPAVRRLGKERDGDKKASPSATAFADAAADIARVSVHLSPLGSGHSSASGALRTSKTPMKNTKKKKASEKSSTKAARPFSSGMSSATSSASAASAAWGGGGGYARPATFEEDDAHDLYYA